MKAFLGAAIAAVVLAGCSTSKLPEEMSYAETQTLIDQILARCEAQGYKKGSREYWACGEHEARRERATRVSGRQNSQKFRMALANGMNAASQGYYNAANTYRPSVNCTSRLGGTWVGQPSHITTSCY